MPPKKAIGSAEDVDGPAVGAVTALVSPPIAYLLLKMS